MKFFLLLLLTFPLLATIFVNGQAASPPNQSTPLENLRRKLATILSSKASEEEKEAAVSKVLKLGGTAHSEAWKLLRVKRQVYPTNSLATELAKEVGYALENLSRSKRQVYGNEAATNLARKAYEWERLTRMGTQARIKKADEKAEKWKRLSRSTRQLDSKLQAEKMARETKRWEKEAFR